MRLDWVLIATILATIAGVFTPLFNFLALFDPVLANPGSAGLMQIVPAKGAPTAYLGAHCTYLDIEHL